VRLTAWGGSLQGRERSTNQDAWGLSSRLGIYVISDGMGGHAQGARAAREVVDAMLAAPETGADQSGPLLESLRQRARQADRRVFQLAEELGHQGNMGATLACLLLDKGRYFMASAGDSRVYLLRAGELSQISQDHTLVAEYLAQGILDQEGAANHPQRHMLTRAMGVGSVLPDLVQGEIRAGDRFMLTSDGVHGLLEPDIMSRILHKAPTCRVAGEALLELVKQRRGGDDATVMVIACEAPA
jgi:serine/threonine protein phosphatase PrpC